MGDGVGLKESSTLKMGATSNMNAARIATLQERKKNIEELLAKRTQELRQICLKEADLTGVIPQEMPLEPGESLPLIRRRVGTSYQLPEKLIQNANENKDELIADLELQMQVHANLAEAALGLANEHNSKTVKRQHKAEYQKHKDACRAIQEKLAQLKEKNAVELRRSKKLSSSEQEDNLSVKTNMNDPRLNVPNDFQDFPLRQIRHPCRNSEIVYTHPDNNLTLRHDDPLNTGFYRLSINGYKNYMERRSNFNNNMHYSYSAHNNQLNLSPPVSYQQHSPLHNLSQHASLHSPMQQHSPHLSQHSPLMAHHSPSPSHSHHIYPPQTPVYMQGTDPILLQHSPQQKQYYPSFDYGKYNTVSRQPSPNSNQKSMYFPSHTIHVQPSYKKEMLGRNPHQIQPHQQYEQNVMTSGLGGCWKKSENGDVIWCNSTSVENNWQRDKRFGSLDRRKNKRVSKRMSATVDNKMALISNGGYTEYAPASTAKCTHVSSRRSSDRLLVRTQSLGSVGAQTVDSVWPSDDNSSCGSETQSINEHAQNRKHKEKEWVETSLDGPVSPNHSIRSRSQSTLPSPSIITPEEKYMTRARPPLPPPIQLSPVSKYPLEIPAESNPSPKVQETNIELFNNNIPKNCTVVQEGICKPYHEETKPFEMSDYYKYSTKFKKSPSKSEPETKPEISRELQRNLSETFEEARMGYSSPQLYPRVVLPEESNDLSHLAVADKYPPEMKLWYKAHERQMAGSPEASASKRSTATLV